MLRIFRLALLLVVAFVARAADAADLRIYYFDIGQGDSALIVSPTGKTVLIDAGPPEGAASLRSRLSELLKAPIDLVILSHPHLDHLGGMEQALSVKGAQLFMDSGFDHPSAAYSSLLSYLDKHGIRVVNATQGRKIDIGDGAVITILGPPSPFFSGTRSDPNANSVIARLTYGKRSFLFSGDAEEETEKMLVSRGGIQSDVLKVPHHGSRHSSTPSFLAAVKPKVAVISVGDPNDYGHPTQAALDRLEGIGAKIHRTDLEGEIRITTDGERLDVTSAGASDHVSDAQEPAPHHGKSIEVQPASQKAGASAGFIASRNSKVFHRADCKAVATIKPENREVFTGRAAALSANKQPAKDCNP